MSEKNNGNQISYEGLVAVDGQKELYVKEVNPANDVNLEKNIQAFYSQLEKGPILCDSFEEITNAPSSGQYRDIAAIVYKDFAVKRLYRIGEANHDNVKLITIDLMIRYHGTKEEINSKNYYARNSGLPYK